MELHLHNLTTNQTTPFTTHTHAPLASHEILLLPHESPDELSNLQTKWLLDFPGETQSILTLRSHLALAELHRNRAQTLLQHLQLDLHWTALPMHHWDRYTQRQFLFLQTQLTRAERHFLRLLKTLQAMQKASEPKPTLKSQEPPKPQHPLVSPRRSVIYTQTATIQVIDGKVVTKCDYDAAHWLRKDAFPLAASFTRQYYFPDAVIPEPYRYVLTDLDVTYEPSDAFLITYWPDDFLRLCQQEIDTHSEYLIDGPRRDYKRVEH